MLPLRDTIPSSRFPIVNWALIAANVAVFCFELSLGRHLERFIFTHGLVPRHFTFPALLTSMFLHGGWAHIFGNMLFLYIFGDNVEDRLGHVRYLAFYLLCGIAAGASQALSAPHSDVPMIGASGAIAGVSGAYLLFFPQSQVVTVVFIVIFIRIVQLPAVLFLGMWFLWQLMSGIATFGAGDGAAGVAFWAHVGGFLSGMALGPALARRRNPSFGWQ